MDPFTAALLIGGGVGLAGGIAQTTANNPSQRLNRQRLDELLNLQRSGGLGLTSTEERLMGQQATDPVRREATANRTRMEQLMAAAGSSASGADLSRLRQEEGKMVGDAVGAAALAVRGADMQKKQAQLNEIEARTGVKGQMRGDDMAAIFGAASQLAAPVGLALGAPPGTVQQGPLMGMRFSPNELAILQRLPPDELAALVAEWRAGGQ